MSIPEKPDLPDLGVGFNTIERSLEELDVGVRGVSTALMSVSEQFLKKCRAERSDLRQRLCKQRPGESVRTSFVYLSLVKKPGTVEFRWSEERSYWNNDNRWDGESSPRRLRVLKNGFPPRTELLRDAHPEEVSMLLRHAEHVVALRESWRMLHKLKATKRMLLNRLQCADFPFSSP